MPKCSTLASISLALLLAGSVGGCGAGNANPSTEATSGNADQYAEPEGVAPLLSCQALIDGGWSLPGADYDLNYQPDTGILDVNPGNGQSFRIDLLNDPACPQLPDIGPQFAEVQSDYEEMRVQECTQAVQDVVNGVVPRKGDIVGSMDALRAHIIEWCPASFATELKRLETSTDQ